MGKNIDRTHRARINKELAKQGKKTCSGCNLIKPIEAFLDRANGETVRNKCGSCLLIKYHSSIREFQLYNKFEDIAVVNKPLIVSNNRKKELGL